MKSFFERFIAACAFLLLCVQGAHAAEFHVIIFGDSLTSGYQLQPEEAYPAKLQRKLQEIGFDVEVINMSIAAETTADGLDRVNSVTVRQPDIVVLELGANDMLRGINPGLIGNNLRTIIGKLHANGIFVILFGMKAPANLGSNYTGKIDSMYRGVLEGTSGFYPFLLDGIVANPELNLADGYHPNAKGVDFMVEKTYRMVDAGLRWKWNVKASQDMQGNDALPPQMPVMQ